MVGKLAAVLRGNDVDAGGSDCGRASMITADVDTAGVDLLTRSKAENIKQKIVLGTWLTMQEKFIYKISNLKCYDAPANRQLIILSK